MMLMIAVAASWAGPAPVLPDNSLYQLDSRWQKDDGKIIKLSDLRGKVRVLSMFFSHCKDICPMILGQLKLLEKDIPPDLWKEMGIVLVTLDSQSDSISALAKYRQEVNLETDKWTLLHGSADDTREMANLLGVQFTPKQEDGQIEHSGLIVLLDSEGRILEKNSALEDRAGFVKRIRNATRIKP